MAFLPWRGADLILDLPLQPGAKTMGLPGIHGERLEIRIRRPTGEWQGPTHLLPFWLGILPSASAGQLAQWPAKAAKNGY